MLVVIKREAVLMQSKKLKTINRLALEIAHEIDGLLDGEEPEKKIFRKAMRILKQSRG